MAKQTLPVNFKDDIMNASMQNKRKYRLINNTDGTVSLEDVTTYDQVGSNFGAGQINATNTAVNAAADASKIIDSLDAIAANTQKGYMAGALAVKDLKKSVADGKALIASAITSMGVSTAADATFETMAANIEKINTAKDARMQVALRRRDGNTITVTLSGNYTHAKTSYTGCWRADSNNWRSYIYYTEISADEDHYGAMTIDYKY